MNKTNVKENIIKCLKETIYPNILVGGRNNNNADPPTNCDNVILISKQFSKSIRQFVEDSISNDIESKINEFNIKTDKEELVKIDACRLTEHLLEQSNISCIHDNLANTLDSCIKELDQLKCLNDSELDISPLLPPEHIVEVAECLSCENPLDVKLNALRILFKSHITEAVNADGWLLLQKKLVDSLCDTNNDIFDISLKIHVKLATSSSPEAIKECALILLETLGQYYYVQQDDSKCISLQNMYYYRMVYITLLLIQTFRESTINVARFGEFRFAEMIDNLVQLLSIYNSNQQLRNMISPLEVISNLDPTCEWLTSLAHFAVLRKLLFSSLQKNIRLLQVIIENIINWINEPFIPNRSGSKLLEGESSVPLQKYSLFIHCFSIFTIICSYSLRSTLFPLKLYNREDTVTVEDILKRLITLINDTKYSAAVQRKSTEMFRVLLAKNISILICLKGINGASYLTCLLTCNDSQNPLDNTMKVKIMVYVSQHEHFNNPFINNGFLFKKNSVLAHYFVQNQNDQIAVMKRHTETERQGSMNLAFDVESSELLPFEIYLKYFTERISQNTKYEELFTLFQITNNIFCQFDGFLAISQNIRIQVIQVVIELYKNLLESFKQANTELIKLSLHGCCLKFLLKVSVSSLDFNIVCQSGIHENILLDGLHDPSIDWTDSLWVLFVSKALTTKEGFKVLANESMSIFRSELNKLWNILEENFSGSELPIEDTSRLLFRVAATFSLSINGVKALISESNYGSDITLMDEREVRPSNMYALLQNFALNAVNCPDYFHHQFALTVLYILSSNLDNSLFLQHKLKYQESLLQIQADNRVDEFSEVIIDECSILRHKIIEQSYLPGQVRSDTKPTHIAPRPESTLARAKPRSRGNSELPRWLTETRSGLHDNNWLKHARKLYRNSADEIKGSTILDLLEQVVKVLPGSRINAKWKNLAPAELELQPEELLAIELVIRYGAHHRLVQSTQQNIENLSQLVLLLKRSNNNLNEFVGFDWFVASAYLICSGNVEKTQTFLSLISALPNASLLWLHLGDDNSLAQVGNLFENIIAEEMPIIFQLLQNIGLSWWHLCCCWLHQCWWNVLDWSQICHWLTMSILHEADHTLYLCIALLHYNQERLLEMKHEGSFYGILLKPVDKFHVADAKVFIDKLHKKYHSILRHNLSIIFNK